MMRQEFVGLVRELCKHFGKTQEPEPEQVGLWFDVVQAIPGDVLSKISLEIRSQHDFFPKNVGKAVKDCWDAMQSEGRSGGPEDRAPAVHCEECGGSGFLYGYRMDVGSGGQFMGVNRYLFRCGHCRRLENSMHGVPMATWRQLEIQGFSREMAA